MTDRTAEYQQEMELGKVARNLNMIDAILMLVREEVLGPKDLASIKPETDKLLQESESIIKKYQ